MTSAQTSFYGTHTERKLQAIERYLKTFLQVLSIQQFETIYIDAFAGTGSLPVNLGGELFDGIDVKNIVEGSALRAVRLERKFSRYIFIEKDAKKLAELKSTIEGEAITEARVQYIRGEAEEEIANLCPLLRQSNVRSVVFLDPFGSQVGWPTLEALANTGHVDLWYLFPAGLSVNRQISSNGRCTPEQERSLDRLFGLHDWRNRLVKTAPTEDLFGTFDKREKSATIDDITRFMIECMGLVFNGGMLKKWLPLGRDGAHWYSLVFAMANPSGKAKKIGLEVAKHIMTTK